MAFTENCNPCERKSIESKSVSWCCECEEGLCDKCLQDHKAMKMTQYHHVVKITSQDLGDNYHLLSIPNCEQHPELKEDLLCKDHDVVCCNGCLVTEHKACKNVVPLDVVAKGVKNSELFQSIKRSMFVNKKVSNDVLAERKASKEELKKQEQRIKKEIANIKSRFIEHINNLEKSLLCELAEIPKESTVDIEKEEQKIEQIERELEADENALTFVAENGSHSQIFSFLRKLKKKQFEIKVKLEEIPSTARVTITLDEASHNIEAINSLGFLSVRYDSVTKPKGKTDHSGMLMRQCGINPHMEIEKEIEIDPTHFLNEEQTYDDLALFVNDFVVTEDNQLLVVGNLNIVNEGTKYASLSQLVKYDVDLKFVSCFNIDTIDDCSWCCINSLTCVPKSEQVVVSDNKRLHFVNNKTMTQMWPSVYLSCLSTPESRILDVTANTIHIFVLQVTYEEKPRFIHVCDLVGRHLKTINFGNEMNYTSITLQPNGNFLCIMHVKPSHPSKFGGSILSSVGPDASNDFLYVQNRMNAVTVDRHGNIYMAVGEVINMMNPCEQQVQKVFTFPGTPKKVLCIESLKDNMTLCVLHKQEHTNRRRKFGTNTHLDSCLYFLQVLTPLK